jgi:hypothetical protein
MNHQMVQHLPGVILNVLKMGDKWVLLQQEWLLLHESENVMLW